MPYNMERIFWIFSDQDSRLVESVMKEFETTKAVYLSITLIEKVGFEFAKSFLAGCF